MRIAIATVEYAAAGMVDGGLANYMTRTVRQLVRRGHECEVVICHPFHLPTDQDRVWQQDGARIHLLSALTHIPARLRDAAIPQELKDALAAAWRIGQCVNERHAVKAYDALHVSNLGLTSLFVETDAPVVMRLSSYWPLWGDAFLWPFDGRRLALELLERLVIRTADVGYAPSRFLARQVAGTLNLSVRHVWPPAFLELPEADWDRKWVKSVTSERRPYLLVVGTLNRLKGYSVLADALPAFWSACPDVDVHVAGRDCGGWAWLKPLNERYPGRIHYHGLLEHARLYPLMCRAMGVVAPYLVDNLGNVLIEALMLGNCLIGTRGTSAEELIEPSGGGLLIPPGDSAALADAMVALARTSDDKRQAMGEQGRAWITRELSPDVAIGQLENLLAEAQTVSRGRQVAAGALLHALCEDLEGLSRMQVESRALARRVSASNASLRRSHEQADYWEKRYWQLAGAFPVRQMRWLRRGVSRLKAAVKRSARMSGST